MKVKVKRGGGGATIKQNKTHTSVFGFGRQGEAAQVEMASFMQTTKNQDNTALNFFRLHE